MRPFLEDKPITVIPQPQKLQTVTEEEEEGEEEEDEGKNKRGEDQRFQYEPSQTSEKSSKDEDSRRVPSDIVRQDGVTISTKKITLSLTQDLSPIHLPHVVKALPIPEPDSKFQLEPETEISPKPSIHSMRGASKDPRYRTQNEMRTRSATPSKSNTEAKTQTETKRGPKPERKAETAANIKWDSETMHETRTRVGTGAKAYHTTIVSTEPQTKPMTYPKAEVKTTVQRGRDTKPTAQIKTDTKIDSKTEGKTEPKPKTKIDAKTIPETKTIINSQRKPKTEGKTGINSDSKIKTNSRTAMDVNVKRKHLSEEEVQKNPKAKFRMEFEENVDSESAGVAGTDTKTEIHSESSGDTDLERLTASGDESESESDTLSIDIKQQQNKKIPEDMELKIKQTYLQMREEIVERIERLHTAVNTDFETLARELAKVSQEEVPEKVEIPNTYVLHKDIDVDMDLLPFRHILRQMLQNTLANVDYQTYAPHMKLLAAFMAEMIRLHCSLLTLSRQRVVVMVDIVDKRATGLFSDITYVWCEDTDRFLEEVFESQTLKAFARVYLVFKE